VTRRGNEMRLVHRDGVKAALEQMACPTEPRIDRADIAPVRLGERRPQAVFVARRDDQVDVVRHQAVGSDLGSADGGGRQLGQRKNGREPMPRDLWKLAEEMVSNPGIGKRIRHSSFMDKYRRHRGLDLVKVVVKTGVTTAINFIPIPIVKDVVAVAFDTGVKAARRKYVKYRRRTTGQLSSAGAVKWGWKDIDLSAFDRYRWKISHAHKELVDAVKYLQEHIDDTASVCNDVVRACVKGHYLLNRMERFREEIEVVQTLINETNKWMSEVELAVERQDFETIIDKYVDFAEEEDEIIGYENIHSHCDPGLCAQQDKRPAVLMPEYQQHLQRARVVAHFFSEFWDPIVADSVSDLPGNTPLTG
jgi:hypothetical protein